MLIKIQNVEHLTAMIKAIVPRSFEKTFGGLTTTEIVAGFAFCTQGLSQTELNTGLAKITQMGYCPDPALFAKWCLGIDGFNNTDAIADSYIGKHGALNAIIQWQANPKTPISVAMKQAFDETYQLWQSIHSQSDNVRAELAFKDCYEHIVNQLIAERIPCKPYTPPVALSVPKEPKHTPADKETADHYINELKTRLKARLKTKVA